MAEHLRLVPVKRLAEEERKLLEKLDPAIDVGTADMLLAYQGTKVVAIVIAVGIDTGHLDLLMKPPPERSARTSGISGIKTAERLDQLLGDEEVPTRRMRIPGSKG